MTAPNEMKPRDYPEDFPHDNGRYAHMCKSCGGYFEGNKHRLICRTCSRLNEKQGAPPAANASERETPRTDAEDVATGCDWMPRAVPTSFARSLERELAEAGERQIELEGDLIQKLGENKAQAEEIERLRSKLRAIQKLGLGPDKGSTGWQAEQAHQIATEALAGQNPAGDGV